MSEDRCPICTRPAVSPYRRYDLQGRVYEGCVSAYHTGHLTPLTESARWHNRPESERCRAALKAGK